ncbi:2-keto-4-pentenoate hydratase/2-oxohepta-3-ene-1,7-dioic acid hydratase in catechol pathway [Bacillus iocasae]|uniref:2-keto-4-pentenoate hydratase/2-oxohepta-3-ene-1,7-dioic acid hydratase in catechol pathway n=1 Tax=Priestia iocasae TaxID=2291674 RepID=A0ABS2QSP2_9BACI|nr:fumarylacetoacetate hydrolase family protein [Metabacillus iocasae]MBM7702471.1 2-keto-4-pentenoate hydratase/2-oxohepta-3-ene-1,7-dioic acid hydratase in catechol pathway [Metabacillus iocasae]
MKFITFQTEDQKQRVGLVKGKAVIDLHEASNGDLPVQLSHIIESYNQYEERIKDIAAKGNTQYLLKDIMLLAPIPAPSSVRDFYSFEAHVKTSRAKRGLEMVPQWYEFPVFYFTNHRSIIGPNEEVEFPPSCQWADYELEVACVIGKEGKNISVDEADDYIFGYSILNDWSARDIQREEVKVGLGPAKGKDFATSLGPYLVTKDELEKRRINDRYNLEMTATVNGKLLSKGNMKDLYYSFSQMIARASEGTTLYPGDVIGSGTVGTGCILELGTDVHRWLQSRDVVELAIDGLGVLCNTVK